MMSQVANVAPVDLDALKALYAETDDEVNWATNDPWGVVAYVPALVAIVDEVRRLHRGPRTERHGSGCVQCGIVWPCPTARVVGISRGDGA